jgi:hypothetical protein
MKVSLGNSEVEHYLKKILNEKLNNVIIIIVIINYYHYLQ